MKIKFKLNLKLQKIIFSTISRNQMIIKKKLTNYKFNNKKCNFNWVN